MKINSHTKKYFTSEERAQLLNKYLRSGMSKSDFAKINAISLSSLKRWLAEASDCSHNKTSSKKFIPVQALPASLAKTIIFKINGIELSIPADIDDNALVKIISGLKNAYR